MSTTEFRVAGVRGAWIMIIATEWSTSDTTLFGIAQFLPVARISIITGRERGMFAKMVNAAIVGAGVFVIAIFIVKACRRMNDTHLQYLGSIHTPFYGSNIRSQYFETCEDEKKKQNF